MKRILISTCIGAICGFIVGIALGLFIIGLAVLYYWFVFGVMFGLIPGAIIGAVIGGIRAWHRSPARSISSAGVNVPTHRRLVLVLITITLCVLIVTPLLFIGQTKLVTYEMRWLVTNEQFPDCKPAVVLMYVGYPEYETFCSAKLQQYLEARGRPTVPMTFSVTYDFGRVRGYRPISIGDYLIEHELDTWGPGASGCGGEFLPACGSGTDTNASPWR